MMPAEQFARSVEANIDYWRRSTGELKDQAFSELDADRQNLFRGVAFGLALPQARLATAELVYQLFYFVERRGYWREWIRVLERTIENLQDEEPLLRCKLLDQLGHLCRLDWRLPAAVGAHRAAEAIALESGDNNELARARFSLSEDYRYERQYEAAEHCGQSALAIFSELNRTGGQIAAALNTLGLIAHARGDFNTAEERLSRAVALFREMNQPTDLARILKNLAMTLEALGKVEAALRCYTEAAALLEGTASELDKVMVDLSLGTLYLNQGRLDDAETVYRRADSPYLRQSGHIYYRALAANNLGNVLLAQGRLDEAEAHLRGSLRLWRETSDGLMLANTLGTLGETLTRQGQRQPALEAYDEALELLTRYPDDAWARHLQAKFSMQREQLPDAD